MFGFWNNSKNDLVVYALPRSFEMQVVFDRFIYIKAVNLFSRILQECFNHSKGLDQKQAATLFDNFNCYNSTATSGLIQLLADGMVLRKTTYIVYDRTSNVVRRANGDEQAQIIKDYTEKAKSDVGILCNFNKFYQSELVCCYLGLLYRALSASNTQLGLAEAIQLKAKDLRLTQSNISHSEFEQQAKQITEGLKTGLNVLIDKDDEIKTSELDSKPIMDAVVFYSQLMAGELGVSTSLVTGVILSGMNSTGEADYQKNEDGVKCYFNSIFKPACDALFGVNLEFWTDNYRRVADLIKTLPYLESSEVVTEEQTKDFVDYVFGVKDV